MNPNLSNQAPVTEIPFDFDEDGFLIDASVWTEETARIIAEVDGIEPLTDDHWSVIRYVRERHLKNGAIPRMRQVCRANNLDQGAVKNLFGSCLAMWRVAGLPNPGEEAKAYMS